MALVNLNDILIDARKNKYAVGAFDVSNYEMLRAMIEAAEEEKSPIILQGLDVDLDGIGMDYLSSMMLTAAHKARIPVCVHIDHAKDIEFVERAIKYGFTSIMFDGSMLPLEENIKNTKKICDLSHKHGVTVEAELGHVGDGISGDSEMESYEKTEGKLTSPDEMDKFIKETKVDALAVSIGTAHGIYESRPELDFERLKELSEISTIPLVLHGASNTPDEDIKKAISLGISKVNIYAEMLSAFYSELRDVLNSQDHMSIWPVTVNERPIKATKELIRKKIRLFGSNNKG